MTRPTHIGAALLHSGAGALVAARLIGEGPVLKFLLLLLLAVIIFLCLRPAGSRSVDPERFVFWCVVAMGAIACLPALIAWL